MPSYFAVRPRPRVPKAGRHTFLRGRGAIILQAATLTAQANVATASLYQNPAGGESGGIELVVVDVFGNRYGTLTAARLRSCSFEKNAISTAVFDFNTNDADFAEQFYRLLPPPYIIDREVQVWRNGRLFWWGVAVRGEANETTATMQLADPLWYFTRRFFGRANRQNLLTDGGFEDLASTAWTAVDTTFARSTAHRITGSRSGMLSQSTFDPVTGFGTNAYVKQTLDDYQATGVGTLLTLVGWFWIDPAAWLGPAFMRLGMLIRRYASDGTSEPNDGEAVAGVFEIDGDTPRGSWQRAETAVHMPPDAINDIEVRLYSPGGVIYWDAVTLTIMESLASAESANDFEMEQTRIAARIVDHAQDPGYGKNNVNITTNTPPSGVERERHYQFADHQAIWPALAEFPALSDGFDVSLEHPDPYSRVFTTHYPRRGSYKPEFALEVGKNIVAFRVSLDGEQVANNVTILSVDSDGPDREEGGATDTSEYGVDLEIVSAAPPGAPIDSLDERAAALLASHLRPEVVEVTVVEDLDGAPVSEQDRARRIIDGLRPCDRTDLRLPVGWVQYEGVYEVVRCEFVADSGAMVFTLNREIG